MNRLPPPGLREDVVSVPEQLSQYHLRKRMDPADYPRVAFLTHPLTQVALTSCSRPVAFRDNDLIERRVYLDLTA